LDRRAYLRKPGLIRVLVRTVEKILDISDSDASLKEEKFEGSMGGEGR